MRIHRYLLLLLYLFCSLFVYCTLIGGRAGCFDITAEVETGRINKFTVNFNFFYVGAARHVTGVERELSTGTI